MKGIIKLELGTKVFFKKLNCIFIGIVEKELVNSYILFVDTENEEFLEKYHSRIVIKKNSCYINEFDF